MMRYVNQKEQRETVPRNGDKIHNRAIRQIIYILEIISLTPHYKQQ